MSVLCSVRVRACGCVVRVVRCHWYVACRPLVAGWLYIYTCAVLWEGSGHTHTLSATPTNEITPTRTSDGPRETRRMCARHRDCSSRPPSWVGLGTGAYVGLRTLFANNFENNRSSVDLRIMRE